MSVSLLKFKRAVVQAKLPDPAAMCRRERLLERICVGSTISDRNLASKSYRFSTATDIGILPLDWIALTFAPAVTKIITAPSLPDLIAACKGVHPLSSVIVNNF